MFFVATANTLDSIQQALLDRMEIIQIPGYTKAEKLEIASKYLVNRQLEENGINQDILAIPDEVISLIIKNYTKEAGVRSLERHIGAICRNIAT